MWGGLLLRGELTWASMSPGMTALLQPSCPSGPHEESQFSLQDRAYSSLLISIHASKSGAGGKVFNAEKTSYLLLFYSMSAQSFRGARKQEISYCFSGNTIYKGILFSFICICA